MRKPFFRRWLGRLHLWLGLVSGLLVLLISVSGALYAFRDELFDWIHRDVLYVAETPAGAPRALSALLSRAQARLGAEPRAGSVTTYADPRRTWEFRAYEAGDPGALTYFGETKHDVLVYVDPYSGRIAGVIDHKREFFQLVKMFHWSFWLSTEIGQPIVGYTVLVFALMLVSGMILWWPKKIRLIAAKLRIPWSAGWKSKVYALHTTLGACALPVSLGIAVTGLAYAFRIVMSLIYVAVNLSAAPPDFDTGKSAPPAAAARPLALDAVHAQAWKRNPEAFSISYGVPGPDEDSATLDAYVQLREGVYYQGSQEHYDRYSGVLIKSRSFAEAGRGEKYLAMNYDIHVGAVLGLPGKILAFCASLISASLPVTGFFIWRGRRKKKRSVPTSSV